MASDTKSSAGRPRPAILLVLDGFGIAPDADGNAISRANTPTFKMLTARYPAMTLRASGSEVGLNWGEMGNSEVGHLAIGAGRVYYQTLARVNQAIASGEYASNQAFAKAITAVKASGGTLHLLGLMSSGKVHSFDDHCFQLLKLLRSAKVKDVAVHAILDGRDTLYNSGIDFIRTLQEQMTTAGVGYLASLSGRYYAMDRDNRWERIEAAYRAMALGESEYTASNPITALEESYAREIFDEEFVPTVITKRGQPLAKVKPGDAVISFNFRPDRVRELTKAFVLPAFDKFAREFISELTFVTMTEYEAGLPVEIAFAPELINQCLAQVLSEAGLVQLHLAETEKYAHVTFFLNGRHEKPFANEDRIIIPSPQVANYATVPDMSTKEITDRLLKEMKTNNYDVMMVNFASPDMLAHTGDLAATIKSIETVDTCVGRLVEAVLEADGVLCITADHGNAEEVQNLQTQAIDKEHSTNPVPFWIVGKQFEGRASIAGDVPNGDLSLMPPVGMLADVAPTFLAILGIPKPDEMTGTSLL